jgi:aminocarboxymuconate-semialdehyde decarboxylase
VNVTKPAAHEVGAELVVDVHAHFMPPDLPDLAEETGDHRWPRLHVEETSETGRVLRGAELFRVVRRPCWDVTARITEMDRLGVDVQVISPIPVSLTYWAEPRTSLRYARHLNDWAAQASSESGGRLLAMGTVPLQDTDLAVAELIRAATELNLAGIELGTSIGDRELDTPELRPFFSAAQSLDIPLFVHPMDPRTVRRARSVDTAFGIGMLTDTALAANALVFGGVLAEFPQLRICLSHGGGALPWMLPRLKFGRSLHDPGREQMWDELVARCYVDSLVFDPTHLALLEQRFGRAHILAGSDYPFLPDGPAPQDIAFAAARLGVVSENQARAINGDNARTFLGPRVTSLARRTTATVSDTSQRKMND